MITQHQHTTIKWTEFQCTIAEMSVLFNCPKLSWSHEKTLPPDLAGMARMKQHERWAGMLLGIAGGNVERQPLCWRSALVRELSSSTGWGDVWPFQLQLYKKDCVALFTIFMALLLSVWEDYSHSFYTLVRLKLEEWAEIIFWHDYFNKQGPAAWTNSLVGSIFSPIQCSSGFTEGLVRLHLFI